MSPLVAVTHHAAERFRQRVGSSRGEVDVKPEIIARVSAAVDAERTTDVSGSVHVTDLRDRSVIYVCRRDGAELIVVTLWEHEDGVAPARVPRRFTDALRRDDEHRRDDA
jgi:hypothetical protein